MKTPFTKLLFSLTVFISFIIQVPSSAQSLVTSIEAESGVLSGVYIANQTSNSSGSYVTGFDEDGDKVTITVNVNTSAYYRLEITYRGNQGTKIQDIYLNNSLHGNFTFPYSTNFVPLSIGNIYLNAGNNNIAVVKNWGYMDVDKVSVYSSQPNQFNIVDDLIDPLATPATRDLYKFLKCQFGHKIISGHTDQKFDSVKFATGKTPMLRAFDFQPYTQGYPYKWENGGHTFGAVDNQITEAAIAWYESTGRKGIVSFQWHWHSPTGGTVSRNTFWTGETTFDVREAVKPGTPQYIDIIEDIDAIAVQLKKLQTSNVPVIWRPLHEAGGTWFWWGAHGSQACIDLYYILFDRLVNYHEIHNLIWAWSSPEVDWYPGNNKVDLIGYDSYPGSFNYTIQKTMFDQLYSIVKGEKLIALTENGPIPDIDKSLTMDAPWSYFMTWDNSYWSGNSSEHLQEVYDNPNVLTIENPGSCVITDVSSSKETYGSIYPNPTNGVLNIEPPIDLTNASIAVINILGEEIQLLPVINGKLASVDVSGLLPGNYLFIITQDDAIIKKKITVIK
ncbi:glycosyl hydrolase [Sporocytophaga myxococcoides]|uniref:glycosyl hydrolase n=1 Tax=Sporocytophaga myxococcoides TaxID=153721 RepID=UPI0003F72E08|nr:glycosyl hydrolase [Sporocytophaga myxococcoides]